MVIPFMAKVSQSHLLLIFFILYLCIHWLFSFYQLLEDLIQLCSEEECEHKQRLLNNMGVHNVVLELLQIPYHKVPA